MKKIIPSVLLLIGFGATVQAQQKGLRLGAHAGIPLSDASDLSSVNLGVDASYLFDVAQNIAVGAATGYSTFLGKDDFDNYSFVPVAVSLRGAYTTSIFYTADIGYAVALESGTKGGLYYQPKLGWTNNRVEAFIFYKGISADGTSLAALGAGVAFKL